MAFRELDLKKVYDTRNIGDNPIRNFYIPVLNEAITYDRGTGYFSSTSLSLAARGIAGFIRNGGRMRILTSPELTFEDSVVLMNLQNEEMIELFIEEKLAFALKDIEGMASLIEKDHLRALAWMISEGSLEIRIAVPRNSESIGGMLHFKLGILTDVNGDSLSFSGSNNESVGGWVRNIEQFKVFKSWEVGQSEYLHGDQEMFDRYWNSSSELETLTISLPDAISKRLINFAPSDTEQLTELLERIQNEDSVFVDNRKLREYQEAAVIAWRNSKYQGVLEMATGTGKTLTASKCIDEIIEKSSSSVVLVVAPLLFLATQWSKELALLEPIMVNGGTDWRSELRAAKSDMKLGLRKSLLLIAVQNTASTDEFIMLLDPLLQSASDRLIVVDEVHGVGAEQFSRLMTSSFEHRLGLSATPNRWFDDEGTSRIMDYFGGVIYTFGIHEALNWTDPISGLTPLCPYDYFPTFVELTDDEAEEYEAISDQIRTASPKGNASEPSDYLKMLLIKRSRIVKKAENKISTLRTILKKFNDYSGTLIYCSDNAQLEEAAEILSELGITYRRFSGEEGAFPKKELGGKSERDVIMNDFESGSIDVLLAMKCLDEGVDIPSAKRGIILASSTNPREFIQRRGRLLRRSPGKLKSEIYDVLVVPTSNTVGDSAEMNMLIKELKRVEEFASDALNEIEIRDIIMEKTWKILR